MRNFFKGIIYGLIPHIGCIAFIIGSIFGVTILIKSFRPLLLSSYFFYILILISLIFATISAILYLKRNGILSFLGIKRKWKYLSVLYGTTIFVNLFLFMVVFPYATNLIQKPTVTGEVVSLQDKVTLKVSIPCPGHAALITDELNKVNGISDVKFRLPNLFDVSYDASKLSKEDILSLEIFKTYKCIII